MPAPRKTLILTGASGIVGRGFLEEATKRFLTCAIGRRPQTESGVPNHPNLRWLQVDIGNAAALERIGADIERQGGADYLIHLAAHSDFENVDRPEFRHTNVDGSRNNLLREYIDGLAQRRRTTEEREVEAIVGRLDAFYRPSGDGVGTERAR